MIPKGFGSLADGSCPSRVNKRYMDWVSSLTGTLNQNSGFLVVKGPRSQIIDKSSIQEEPTTYRAFAVS